jgi:Domain of unknown function (DUF4265)
MGDMTRRRMVVPLPSDEPAETESLWVQPTDVIAEFVVDNIPLLAKGISRGDVVEADEIGGALVYSRVVRRCGRTTYQMLVRPEGSQADWTALILRLQQAGASFEGVDARLVSFDFPEGFRRSEIEADLESAWVSGIAWYQIAADPQADEESSRTH